MKKLIVYLVQNYFLIVNNAKIIAVLNFLNAKMDYFDH